MWAQIKRVIKDNGAIALFGSQPFTSILITSNLKMFKYEWIWDKRQGTGFLNANKQPLRNNEEITIFYEKQCTYNAQMRKGEAYKIKQGKTKTECYGKQLGAITNSTGNRFPLTILKFNTDNNKLHPTQKPVKLLEYLIKTYTVENETVLDFTMGSGSTGVACIETNRNFIGIELDEKYFKIATDRIDKAKQSPKLFY